MGPRPLTRFFVHLKGCVNQEGPSPSENIGEAAMVWGQRMYFLGQMMVQEEVGQETVIIIQVWSWTSRPARPSGSGGQGRHREQGLSISLAGRIPPGQVRSEM